MTNGFVSLVGGGPGDPGLLTIAGRDRLAHCDVVIYDRLANPALLEHVPAAAERIFAGKSPEHKAFTQDEINAMLVAEGLKGKRVVRLKGGDPFVFGRGGEEALALAAAGVPFEVVPGVTSAIAAPAYAGVPVTHRGLASSFAVITGHEDDEKEESSIDWARLATGVDTIVVLMGGAALPGVAKALIRNGRPADTPAVSVEWGTTTAQRSVAAPLDSIANAVREARLGTPLLTVVGQVATLREHIAWFENRPLFGKRVLVTRTRQQSSALADLLRRSGAVPVELPTLDLVPVANDARLEAMTAALETQRYAWCLFTSTNAVDHVFAYLDRTGRDARAFAGCRVAALGSATAAQLKRNGLRADLVASEFSSEGLLAAMTSATSPDAGTSSAHPEALEGRADTSSAIETLSGARILIPRAEGGSPILDDGLRAAGAEVDEVILYESRPPAEADPEALELIRARRIDVATFASSSSVRNLKTLLGPDFDRLRAATIAVIGPQTAQTARDLGLEVSVEPEEHTIPALVEALVQHFASSSAHRDLPSSDHPEALEG